MLNSILEYCLAGCIRILPDSEELFLSQLFHYFYLCHLIKNEAKWAKRLHFKFATYVLICSLNDTEVVGITLGESVELVWLKLNLKFIGKFMLFKYVFKFLYFISIYSGLFHSNVLQFNFFAGLIWYLCLVTFHYFVASPIWWWEIIVKLQRYL